MMNLIFIDYARLTLVKACLKFVCDMSDCKRGLKSEIDVFLNHVGDVYRQMEAREFR